MKNYHEEITLISYIGIKGLVGTQHYPVNITIEQLSSKYDYLLGNYNSKDNNGNWSISLSYITNGLVKQPISVNGWVIDKIYGTSNFVFKGISFVIKDPEGKNNEEAKVITKTKKGTFFSICFNRYNVLESLNVGLSFFGILSKYKNWEEFLASDEKGDFTKSI